MGEEKIIPKKESIICVRVLELLDITDITTLTSITTLTNKDKILIYLIYPNSISDISKGLTLSLDLVSKNIKFKERGTGLLYDGYVELFDSNRYILTDLGIEYLKDIYQSFKQKKDFEKVKYDRDIEVQEQIKLFVNFLDMNYKDTIKDLLRKGDKSLYIDFMELAKFNPEIAEILLDNPEETIKVSQIALDQFDNLGDLKRMKVRFTKLPNTQKINIAEFRTQHLNKIIKIIGSPITVSEVRPQVISAKFECPACANIINVLQLEKIFKEPIRCGCGRKGKFRLLDKELIDSQLLKLEELSEHLGSRSQQKKMIVSLSNDLTHIENQPFFESSQPIIINGILKEQPIFSKGEKSTRIDFIVEANSIEFDENIKQINLTEEKIKECKVLSQDKELFTNLVKSFAPSVFNKEKEKEAILYSMVSGGGKKTNFRDDSHLLMVGDPGTAKSSLALEINKIIVGSRWISGKGASSAGIIGTVRKDEEFGGDIVLEKGALPMANNNICICDELDKMNINDTNSLHEPLENQSCSIDKWNKHQRFTTDNTFIACANPEESRFNKGNPILPQINLPDTLKDRFDIIMPFFDIVGKEDFKLAEKIHKKFSGELQTEDLIKYDLLRNYLHYARSNFNPSLTKEAKKEITDYFVLLRGASVGSSSQISISPRHLEGLIRLTRARAKIRLSHTATIEDSKAVIELFDYFMKELDLDVEEYRVHKKEEIDVK